VGARLHRCRVNSRISARGREKQKKKKKKRSPLLYIKMALDKPFLQEGQIGFSSSVGLEDSDGMFERAEDGGKVNFTGNRFFSLGRIHRQSELEV
jgi:hypothetical protein